MVGGVKGRRRVGVKHIPPLFNPTRLTLLAVGARILALVRAARQVGHGVALRGEEGWGEGCERNNV